MCSIKNAPQEKFCIMINFIIVRHTGNPGRVPSKFSISSLLSVMSERTDGMFRDTFCSGFNQGARKILVKVLISKSNNGNLNLHPLRRNLKNIGSNRIKSACVKFSVSIFLMIFLLLDFYNWVEFCTLCI